MNTIRSFYSLTKPGVLYGNAITAAAGFMLASRGQIDSWLFLSLFFGTSFVIASACATNNVLDRDIDAKMERTKNRAIVAGKVKASHAAIFAIVIGLIGFTLLLAFTNSLVVIIGIIGFVDYVWLYGAWSKRKSVHGTLIGSISGATPVLAGYVAVTGTIDLGAIVAFMTVFLWQQPEFYSIALYRLKEYKAAGIPVISIIKGVRQTKIQILAYISAFIITCALLTVFGYTGLIFLIVIVGHGLYWLWIGLKGFATLDENAWGRAMFRQAMVAILVLSIMMAAGPLLP